MPDSLPATINSETPVQRGRGRPELYTEEIADEVCDRLAEGESLRSICKYTPFGDQLIERTGKPWFPSAATICRWMEHNTHGFTERYARVRVIGYDQMAMQALEIADNCTVEDFQPARVRIDTRKWFLSKVDPKRYGDKLTLAGDPANPIEVVTDDTALARRAAFLLSIGNAVESDT